MGGSDVRRRVRAALSATRSINYSSGLPYCSTPSFIQQKAAKNNHNTEARSPMIVPSLIRQHHGFLVPRSPLLGGHLGRRRAFMAEEVEYHVQPWVEAPFRQSATGPILPSSHLRMPTHAQNTKTRYPHHHGSCTSCLNGATAEPVAILGRQPKTGLPIEEIRDDNIIPLPFPTPFPPSQDDPSLPTRKPEPGGALAWPHRYWPPPLAMTGERPGTMSHETALGSAMGSRVT